MGSPMGGAPADPMGGAGAPPPMDPMGGMGGGDPMGGMGGGDPMGGMGGEQQAQPVPTHADVWEVLDAILHNKKIKEPKPAQIMQPPGGGMGGMGAPPMGGDPMGGMGAPPMGGGAPPAPMDMGAPGPAGGGGPFLQG